MSLADLGALALPLCPAGGRSVPRMVPTAWVCEWARSCQQEAVLQHQWCPLKESRSQHCPLRSPGQENSCPATAGLTVYIPEQEKGRLKGHRRGEGAQRASFPQHPLALLGEIDHPQQWPQLFSSAPKEADLGSRYQRGPFLQGLLSGL